MGGRGEVGGRWRVLSERWEGVDKRREEVEEQGTKGDMYKDRQKETQTVKVRTQVSFSKTAVLTDNKPVKVCRGVCLQQATDALCT